MFDARMRWNNGWTSATVTSCSAASRAVSGLFTSSPPVCARICEKLLASAARIASRASEARGLERTPEIEVIPCIAVDPPQSMMSLALS
ncbi:MAG: hypothetical protein ACK56F_12460, partial [bacterium]